MNPVTTEQVKGGTIMYFDYWTDCSEDFKGSKPSLWLVGFDRTHSGVPIRNQKDLEKKTR